MSHKQISLSEVKVLIGKILKVLTETDMQLPEFEINYRICNNALSVMYNSQPNNSQNINRIFQYPDFDGYIDSLDEFNVLISKHTKLVSTLLPVGDGVTLAIKNKSF